MLASPGATSDPIAPTDNASPGVAADVARPSRPSANPLAKICSANVATLVFARTATRSWEITVRTALGANRGRIISQLFIEALVLAGVAALLGLVIAKVAMR